MIHWVFIISTLGIHHHPAVPPCFLAGRMTYYFGLIRLSPLFGHWPTPLLHHYYQCASRTKTCKVKISEKLFTLNSRLYYEPRYLLSEK
jgi:hypothetical protein